MLGHSIYVYIGMNVFIKELVFKKVYAMLDDKNLQNSSFQFTLQTLEKLYTYLSHTICMVSVMDHRPLWFTIT